MFAERYHEVLNDIRQVKFKIVFSLFLTACGVLDRRECLERKYYLFHAWQMNLLLAVLCNTVQKLENGHQFVLVLK